jgi:hypothetical protein
VKRKWLTGLAVGLLMIGIVGTGNATIVNMDAKINSNSNPVVVFFNAGTYDVIPIGVADGGTYNAWNAWAGNPHPPSFAGWLNYYSLSSGEFGTYTIYDGIKYPTDLDALKNSLSTRFTLTSAGNVNFFLEDYPYWDNVGGMSLKVTPASVPPVSPALTVTVEGNGTVSAAGVTCKGATCTGTYPENAWVNITAVPGSGYATSWTGCDSSSGDTCSVVMKDDVTITVRFHPANYPPTVMSAIKGRINFGRVAEGVPYTAPLIIKNTGKKDLYIYSVSIVGSDPSSYSYTSGDCFGSAIAPKGVCHITVSVVTGYYGPDPARLDIAANIKGGVKMVPLSANAIKPKIVASPMAVSFGTTVALSPLAKTVRVKNVGITALEINDIKVTDDTSGDFTVDSASVSACTPLHLNEHCDISLTFSPTTTGKKQANLRINTNDPQKPEKVLVLRGVGK